MFTAQLAAFLVDHHHAMWQGGLFESVARFEWLYRWALHHGFMYQP